MDPLDLVACLPRRALRLIPVAFVVGFTLSHAQTMRVFDAVVQYELNQKRAQLLHDFQPIMANARRELQSSRPAVSARP